MSRLDSFLRRMSAQKVLLDLAADLVRPVPGAILELGLGSGRTYDHLRECLPDREIFVFDTHLMAEPDLIPDSWHMIRGDIRQTLKHCLARIGGPAAMLHNDIATGDAIRNAATAHWLAPLVTGIMAPGGLVVSSFTMELRGYQKLDLPAEIPPGRYHIYRNSAA